MFSLRSFRQLLLNNKRNLYSYCWIILAILIKSSTLCAQQNETQWQWDPNRLNELFNQPVIMAYDSEGTFRPLCRRDHLSDQVEGSVLGLSVIDRSFPDTGDFNECKPFIVPRVARLREFLLTHTSMSSYQWLLREQWLSLSETQQTAGLQVESETISESYPATFCQAIDSSAPTNELGKILPGVGVTSIETEEANSNQCHRGVNITSATPWRYLGLVNGQNRVASYSVINPINSVVHPDIDLILEDHSPINKLPEVIISSEFQSPFSPDALVPCIPQETRSTFNLGVVVNGIVYGNFYFPGGCIYSNTGNTKSFIAHKYYRMTLPEGVRAFNVSPGSSPEDEIWDQALFAGERPEEADSTRLYLCSAEKTFMLHRFISIDYTFFGRTVRGSHRCFYSSIDLDYDNTELPVSLSTESSENFKIYLSQEGTPSTSNSSILRPTLTWMSLGIVALILSQ